MGGGRGQERGPPAQRIAAWRTCPPASCWRGWHPAPPCSCTAEPCPASDPCPHPTTTWSPRSQWESIPHVSLTAPARFCNPRQPAARFSSRIYDTMQVQTRSQWFDQRPGAHRQSGKIGLEQRVAAVGRWHWPEMMRPKGRWHLPGGSPRQEGIGVRDDDGDKVALHGHAVHEGLGHQR